MFVKTNLPPKVTRLRALPGLVRRLTEKAEMGLGASLLTTLHPPLPSSHSYIPVLMAQARIYWDTEDYQQVEKIFRKSVEFCSEHDTWKLNVAHVLFMQVGGNTVSFLCHLTTWE